MVVLELLARTKEGLLKRLSYIFNKKTLPPRFQKYDSKIAHTEMGKYRVLRFEFPELRVPRFGKLGHLNRIEFSAYSSEFSASGKLGQLNLTEFSAYSSEFSAKGVLDVLTSIGIFASLVF